MSVVQNVNKDEGPKVDVSQERSFPSSNPCSLSPSRPTSSPPTPPCCAGRISGLLQTLSASRCHFHSTSVEFLKWPGLDCSCSSSPSHWSTSAPAWATIWKVPKTKLRKMPPFSTIQPWKTLSGSRRSTCCGRKRGLWWGIFHYAKYFFVSCHQTPTIQILS